MKKLLLILLTILISVQLQAQSITVQAPQTVYLGDNFTVRFTIDGQAKDFHGPSFKGFSTLSGPNTSSSTSMSFVNGQMSRSYSMSFSYTLRADIEGKFKVDEATCTVDGKKITSQSFSITVEKPSPAQQQQQQSRQQNRQSFDPWAQQSANDTPVQIDEKTLFARTSVNKSAPYQGEQIIVTYKIYTQIPISQYQIDKLPGNKGFWSEDLSDGKRVKQYEETIDGKQYQVAEIRRGALFAQESGNLSIDPIDVDVLAMLPTQRRRTGSIWDLFDDPFFNPRQAVERKLSTNKINIKARPLPQGPENFCGAVGNFNIQGGINDKKTKTNEAIKYTISISGSGNIMLIDAPTPEFPSTFEVFDPQISDNINKSDNGISGNRTYEWILIPRSKGEYTIPKYSFVYFDPQSGQYVTKHIESQTIEVEQGDALNTTTLPSKDDVRIINSDINYMHPIKKLKSTKTIEHVGMGFWLSAILIIILTIILIILVRRHHKEAMDVAGMRMKQATRMARKRLKLAEKHLGDGNDNLFYEEIYRAIWGCLADKYNIELSKLNHDTVSTHLSEKQVPQETQQRIMQMLQDVDLARFTPNDTEDKKRHIYDEAIMMIASL